MKKYLLILTVMLTSNSYAMAQDTSFEPKPMTNQIEQQNQQYLNDTQSNQQHKYRSDTGTQYQYDMHNPEDRILYKHDIDAQVRDRVIPNPTKKIDKSIGQEGRGIYPDY